MIEIPVVATQKKSDKLLYAGAVVIPNDGDTWYLSFSKPVIASVAFALAKACAFDRMYSAEDVDLHLVHLNDIIAVEME